MAILLFALSALPIGMISLSVIILVGTSPRLFRMAKDVSIANSLAGIISIGLVTMGLSGMLVGIEVFKTVPQDFYGGTGPFVELGETLFATVFLGGLWIAALLIAVGAYRLAVGNVRRIMEPQD